MGCYSITGYSPAFYQVDPTIHWYPFIHLGGERHCAQRDLSKGSNLNPLSSRSALALLMQSSRNPSMQGVPLPKFGKREIYNGTYISGFSFEAGGRTFRPVVFYSMSGTLISIFEGFFNCFIIVICFYLSISRIY